MSTRPRASILGADDESDMNQTLGDTGGMSGSLALGMFAAGGNQAQSSVQGSAEQMAASVQSGSAGARTGVVSIARAGESVWRRNGGG